MEFSRQEYWSGLPFPFAGDLPNSGIESWSSALWVHSLPSELPGKSNRTHSMRLLEPSSQKDMQLLIFFFFFNIPEYLFLEPLVTMNKPRYSRPSGCEEAQVTQKDPMLGMSIDGTGWIQAQSHSKEASR